MKAKEKQYNFKRIKQCIIDFRSKLGNGQSGKVYMAIVEATNEAVAVKVLPLSQKSNDRRREENAFLCEMQIISKARSPNII